MCRAPAPPQGIGLVTTHAAIDLVIAPAAIDEIGAKIAVSRVVPAPERDRVIAETAIDLVIAVQGRDIVIAAQPEDRVIAIGALQVGVTERRAGDTVQIAIARIWIARIDRRRHRRIGIDGRRGDRPHRDALREAGRIAQAEAVVIGSPRIHRSDQSDVILPIGQGILIREADIVEGLPR